VVAQNYRENSISNALNQWFNVQVNGKARVALIHSYYSKKKPSGENRAVDNLASWLIQDDYIEFQIFSESSPDHPSLTYRIKSAFRVVFGIGRNFRKSLSSFDPDVIHVHNIFPNISKRTFEKIAVKKILTIHNFRPLCANGLFLRDNKFCNLCLHNSPFNAVRYSCYRDSKLATLPWYFRQLLDPKSKKYLNIFQKIIFLNEMVREIYLRAIQDLPSSITIPNLIEKIELKPGGASFTEPYVVYAGNISPEKGIYQVALNWELNFPNLKIFGSGVDENAIQKLGKENVELIGLVENTKIIEAISGAICIIIPSLCLENLPNIYVEALSQGVPIIASSSSIPGKLVQNEVTGVTFKSINDLSQAISKIQLNRKLFVDNCIQIYNEKYSANIVKIQMRQIYSEKLNDENFK
jgi:glycosyltransferase involved in cell wall biosynthesis